MDDKSNKSSNVTRMAGLDRRQGKPAAPTQTAFKPSGQPRVNMSDIIAPTETTTTTTTSTARGPSTPSKPSTGGAKPSPSFQPNIVPRAKKEFAPNLVPRKKQEENKVDMLISGTITDLLKDSLTPIGTINEKPKHVPGAANRNIRSNINPNRNRKPPPTMSNTPMLPLSDLPDSLVNRIGQRSEEDRLKAKLNEEFINQLFHEMEIDPMQPNHPTHLPLVDPRKVMKEYSLSDAQLDLDLKKKEIQSKIANGELSDQKTINGIGSGEDGEGVDQLLDSMLSNRKKREEELIKPFFNEGIFLNEDHLFFLQLPTSLPSSLTRSIMPPPHLMMIPPPQMMMGQLKPGALVPVAGPPGSVPPKPVDARLKKPAAAPGAPVNPEDPTKPILNSQSFVPKLYPGDLNNTLKYLPEGRLGTMRIYKSGKVFMKLGEVDFEISACNKLKFLEEVKCITHEGPTCFNLGTPAQHLVAAPILSSFDNKNK